MQNGYTIRCYCHTYVTLDWNGKFVYCGDNDMTYMEDIVEKIEKRTQMRFRDIPVKGSIQDFDGLRYLHGGFKKGREIFA